MERKKKWKKVLYEDQGVPDNYVDESFLEEMKKNLHITEYKYWTTVMESGVITQQLSSLCIFVIIFIYMSSEVITPHYIFSVSSLASLCGYAISTWLPNNNLSTDQKSQKRTSWDDIKSASIFLTFGYGLAPILMTLTDTISTDTIYAMTAAMLVANLLFHEYGDSTVVASQPLSLNAAIFASVCLASRLPTTWHGFVTITIAVEIFALWPILRRKIKVTSALCHNVMTIVLGFAASLALYNLSRISSALFSLLHLFITFICPLWLIKMQPYKNNIYGPWDEAVIKDS